MPLPWLTPPAPAAVAVAAIDPGRAVLDRPPPGPGRVGLRRILGPGGVADEAVVAAMGGGAVACTHGGPGIRAAVSAALAGCGADPGFGAAWDRLAAAAHPAAVRLLLAGADPGPFAGRPPVVLITGPANAGKSTLLNAWCGWRRALVGDAPGTTRDLVAATALVAGWRLRLVDSAGLRATADPLERAGQELVAAARRESDLVIYLDDPGQPAPGPQPGDLVVAGKADLRPAPAGLAWTVRDPGTGLARLGRAVLERLGLPPLPEDAAV